MRIFSFSTEINRFLNEINSQNANEVKNSNKTPDKMQKEQRTTQ